MDDNFKYKFKNALSKANLERFKYLQETTHEEKLKILNNKILEEREKEEKDLVKAIIESIPDQLNNYHGNKNSVRIKFSGKHDRFGNDKFIKGLYIDTANGTLDVASIPSGIAKSVACECITLGIPLTLDVEREISYDIDGGTMDIYHYYLAIKLDL